MGRKRAKNLDPEMVEAVLQVLDVWQGKLTWDLLVERVHERTGQLYTRQALSGYQRILSAYQDRKKTVTKAPKKKRSAASYSAEEVQTLLDSNVRLTAQNKRLQNEIDRLHLQFDVWIHHAHSVNLTKDFFDRMLPTIDREASD